MIGTISYVNASRRFALLTPVGRNRDHDIFCHQIHFELADIDLPFVGQLIEFSVQADRFGKLEAVDLQVPKSDSAAGVDDREIEAAGGAEAGGGGYGSTPAAAGNISEG